MADNIFWYFVGLLTVPMVGGVWIFLSWAFSKTEGSDGCVAECVGADVLEIGDHFNITVWFWRTQHRLLFSTQKSHKAAVRKYWQDIYDNGGQTRTDVGVIYRVR